MPVLGQDDMLEGGDQPVDDRDDLMASRDGERAAGTEIVLNIDDDEARIGALFPEGSHGLFTP
jgi:hypothetical protein